jgi:hypothetical protein
MAKIPEAVDPKLFFHTPLAGMTYAKNAQKKAMTST